MIIEHENELEIETYEIDEEPRLKLDVTIGSYSESLIIEGEDYLKQIRDNINNIIKER